ncbi:caspase-7-like [Brevipalpus obovatus]|uniref:caspase-7-like n=1 Tax=Brevipalpus obovatus TaxID=246614 RepID=UPI003D9ECF5A
MDQTHHIINSNLETLSVRINGIIVGDLLVSRKVLTDETWCEIKGSSDCRAVNELLLLTIAKLGPEALYALKEVLYECNDLYSMELLNSEGGYCPDLPSPDIIAQPSTSPWDRSGSSSNLFGSIATDGAMFSRLKCRSEPTEPADVVSTEKWKEGPKIYPMSKKPRGYCLIFNNIHFQTFRPRESASGDSPYLANIFDQLHFEVREYENMTCRAMKDVLGAYSRDKALKEHQAFVCIIMSHGVHDDYIVGTDALIVKLEELVTLFNNSNCPNLINKPKMFFIQACRGDDYDQGIRDALVQTDAIPIPPTAQIDETITLLPTWSDICIVHSTMRGYVAFRCPETGSWFAQALGKALTEHAHDMNLQEILQQVAQYINTRPRSQSTQAIEWSYRSWWKTLYFNPGLTRED